MTFISQSKLLYVLLFISIGVQVRCKCSIDSKPSIPVHQGTATLLLTRCGRNPQPTIHLIPATLCSNGVQHYIRPFSSTQSEQQMSQPIDVKRPTRQQQSAVIQQVTINQNTAFSSGLPSFGFGGFKHPFSSPHHHSSHGFGSPHSFGGFRGRTQQEESIESISAHKCPLNYIFSCQPTVTEVHCNINKSC